MAIGLGYLSAEGQPTIVEVLFTCWSGFTALMALAAMFASAVLLTEKKDK